MNEAKENVPAILKGFLEGVFSLIPIGNITVNIINELGQKQVQRKIERMMEF